MLYKKEIVLDILVLSLISGDIKFVLIVYVCYLDQSDLENVLINWVKCN